VEQEDSGDYVQLSLDFEGTQAARGCVTHVKRGALFKDWYAENTKWIEETVRDLMKDRAKFKAADINTELCYKSGVGEWTEREMLPGYRLMKDCHVTISCCEQL
jgi:hypothetical protein